ncbi:fibronectin type III domain-containing protein, partial [Bacteroidales bacterium OttesenSCG-928-I14]|nr:fibronectin type III domain-containing protein [Bacteroidales bacterium OttesenSCG-928-I14]
MRRLKLLFVTAMMLCSFVSFAANVYLVDAKGYYKGSATLEGTTVTLPSISIPESDDCAVLGWTFAGWSAKIADITAADIIAAGTYNPVADITLNAVYMQGSGGIGGKETLRITRSNFPSGALGYNVTDIWEATTSGGEVIEGEGDLYSLANQTTMQTKNSGVSTMYHNTTAIPGSITKITLACASGSTRTYTAYMNANTAITSTSGGTSKGTIAPSSGNTANLELDAADGWRYFWLNLAGGASFLDYIEIEYQIGGSAVYDIKPTCFIPTVTLNDRGTTSTLKGFDVILDDVTIDQDCADAGWEFIGWSTKSDNITEEDIIGTGAYETEADITLYAVYKIGEGEGGTIALTNSEIIAINEIVSYGDSERIITNEYGDWKFRGYRQSASADYIQIKSDTTPSYIKLPEVPGNISSIDLTFTNGANGNFSGTLYLKEGSSNNTSDKIASSAMNGKTGTITVAENCTTGYITASATCRINSIDVYYGNFTYTYTTNPDCGTTVPCTAATASFAAETITKTIADVEFTNAFTTNNASAKVFESSDENVAMVDEDGEVVIMGAGTATITVTQVEDTANNICAVEESYTLTVYNITVAVNNTAMGDVAVDGYDILAQANAGYQFADPVYTVSPVSAATVTDEGDGEFTISDVTADVIITINFEAIPVSEPEIEVTPNDEIVINTTIDVEGSAGVQIDAAHLTSNIIVTLDDDFGYFGLSLTANENDEYVLEPTNGVYDDSFNVTFKTDYVGEYYATLAIASASNDFEPIYIDINATNTLGYELPVVYSNETCNGFTIAWDDVPNAVDYDVVLKYTEGFDDGRDALVEIEVNSPIDVTGLEPNTTYEVIISAFLDNGNLVDVYTKEYTTPLCSELLVDETLSMSAIIGSVATTDVEVSANNMLEDITVSIEGDGVFSLASNLVVLSIEDGAFTGNFSVSFEPVEAGVYTATITLSSGDVTETIEVTGTTELLAPEALAATEVTCEGFTANWNVVEGASAYILLFDSGRIEVAANDFVINGLEEKTNYTYKVIAVAGDFESEESNEISVTTDGCSVLNVDTNPVDFVTVVDSDLSAEVAVLGEYLNENIELSIDGDDAISLSTENLVVEGDRTFDGSFYILLDASVAGTYSATVTVSVGDITESIEVTATVDLSTPTDLLITDLSCFEISAQWNAVAGASTYNVYLDDVFVKNVSTTSLSLAVSDNADHKLGVEAVYNSIISEMIELEFTTPMCSEIMWIGAVNDDWNNPLNWSPNVVPSADRVVYINGQSENFPVLTEAKEVAEIHFAPGAELGRQDLLTYEKAHVQMNFGNDNKAAKMNTGCWHMLSMPINAVYAGDMSFGGYPYTYMRKLVIRNEKGKSIADFSEDYKSNGEKLNVGDGFLFWLNSEGNEFGSQHKASGIDRLISNSVRNYGIGQTDGILELPYFENQVLSDAHRIHKYNAATKTSTMYSFSTTRLVSSPAPVKVSRVDAYRLAEGNTQSVVEFPKDADK